jgi:cytochrome b6-f complex iron-sulfur subunit
MRTAPSTDRRGFLLTLVMVVGLVLSYGTALVYGFQFLYPRRGRRLLQRIYVTSPQDLRKKEYVSFLDLNGREVLLVETDEGYRALSTVCTHLGCRVYWEPEVPRFFCPCHEGVFDVNGDVISGPPPAPLRRYEVEEEEGALFVVLEG